MFSRLFFNYKEKLKENDDFVCLFILNDIMIMIKYEFLIDL